MSRRAGFLGSVFTVGGWTMLSRVAGLVRDLMIGAMLGAGPVADAFLAAFALPNMFRRFFAEGAFNIAFVPMFAKKLEAGEDPADFAKEAFSGLALILLVLTLLAQLAMPLLVLATTSGYAADERFDLAVFYGRICFPYILVISLAALISGVLNASGRFAAAAAAPVLLNVILIGVMSLALWLELDFGISLSVGVILAGVAQFVLVWKAAARIGFRLTFKMPDYTGDLKRLAIIALPAAMAGGVMQINLLVGRQVASYFEGAVSWLYFADRLYQLPLGVVGIAIGIVLLPDLARRLRKSDETGGREAFNRATEFALVLTLPCAAALMVIPNDLVSVLFQRGHFGAKDTAATAAAVAVYGAGLPAFVLQKILQPLYFARENTRTPFYFALVSMVLNGVLAVGLSYYIGYLAAAIATTISATVLSVLLWVGTWRMGAAAAIDARLRRNLPRILAATGVMAAAIYAMSNMLHVYLVTGGLRYGALALLIIAAAAIYFMASILLGAFSRADMRGFLRR